MRAHLPSSSQDRSLFQRDELSESCSDIHSAVSRVTSSSANDLDNLPFPITFRMLVIFSGATIGGLLFGYDTGVISGVLLSLKPQDLALTVLTDFQKELITSVTSLGSFFGSILGFPLSDKYGRKATLAICCVVFIVAAVWMALSTSLSFLIFGRFLVGIAVGVAAQCVPIYLSEISPSRIRGTILALNSIAITSGQLIAYILAYYMTSLNQSWRYLFGFSAIPAIIFILLLDFIPESPRWLISQGKITEAHKSLSAIYSTAPSYMVLIKLRRIILNIVKYQDSSNEATPLLDDSLIETNSTSASEIQSSTNYESSPHANIPQIEESNNIPLNKKLNTLKDNLLNETKMFYTLEGSSKRALSVGCILMFLQQVTGFNAFMYYAGVIFSRFGIENPLLPAIAIAFTNFLFTIISMQFVDRIGRRTMLLYTVLIMTFGLEMCSVAFGNDDVKLTLIATIIFVAAYALAMGSIPWNSVEFLPMDKRSFGASCISCTNWLTNSIVSMTYLTMMDKIGNKNTMLAFASFTVLNWIFVYFWYPEVKGLSLEEIQDVFKDGIDVHYVYRKYHF